MGIRMTTLPTAQVRAVALHFELRETPISTKVIGIAFAAAIVLAILV